MVKGWQNEDEPRPFGVAFAATIMVLTTAAVRLKRNFVCFDWL
jgi:hypothetical protein